MNLELSNNTSYSQVSLRLFTFLAVPTTFFPSLVQAGVGGSPDPSFNATGTVITSFGSGSGATAVATQSDGKIVVAGVTGSTTNFSALVRCNSDGTMTPKARAKR